MIASVRGRRTAWRVLVRRGALLAWCLGIVAFPAVAHAGFLNVQWDVPTTNDDGSPLLDLAGYRVYAATSVPACPGTGYLYVASPVSNPSPGQTFPATLTNLNQGTTYFVRVSAVDTSGNESACTSAVSGVARAALIVTPAALNFGSVIVGATASLDLTVQNVSGAVLTGTATTAAPFSIESGGTLNLAPGASQIVRVRFAPTSVQTFVGGANVTVSGDGVSRALSGVGVAAPPAVLQFSQPSFAVTEGGTATISVMRTGGMHGGVTVRYATANTTATAGSDYTAASGTLTFGAGQTSRTFTVATLADTLAEGPETVSLTLSNPQGNATLAAPNPATLTIVDDDVAGTVQLGAAAYTVAEGAGSVTVNVTRTGGAASGVTVAYATANGSATAGQDYSARSGTLTFNAGVTSLPIVVPILQDPVMEPAETFTLTLSNPGGGASLGAPRTATVTITDDGDAPAVLQFGQASSTVTEGGTASVTVTRTGAAHAGVTVDYAMVGGSAVPGVDYTAATGTLIFGVNQMSRTLPVVTRQNTTVDTARSLTLVLSNPQGGGVLGAPASATLTINDDDLAGMVQFGGIAYTVGEATPAVTVTVTRTGGAAGGVTVNYATADGSATAGADYSARSGTLTFNAGVTSLPIVVPILQDAIPEGSETFTLRLSNPGGGASLGGRDTVTVTITDDEPNLRFSAAVYTVAETARTATVTVSRAGSTAGALTVDYTTTATGTATAGVDFTPVSGTLSFAPGQTSRTFTVPILDDDVVDGPKTVGLQLANAVGAGLGSPATATLTITDSDVAGSIQFATARTTTDEGAGTVTVTVIRTGGSAAGVSASYAITGGTATPGVDFVLGGSGTVTFGSGVTAVTIPISLVDDTLLEGAETLELTLSNPTGGAVLGAVRQATVTIDEMAFQFAPAAYSVVEGGVATITVVRTGPVSRSATVEWSTGDGTAAAGSDYVAGAGTLTFPAGVGSRTFSVSTVADTVAEEPETVLLRLRNPSSGAILGAQQTAVVTINDNDAGGRISFSPAAHVVPENRGLLNVPVVRVGGVASSVTVGYSVIGGTATGGGVDFTLADGTLTFAAGQTTAMIPLTIVDDGLVEANETIVVQLHTPTGGATLGAATVTITITDNDRSSTLQFSAASYTVVEGAGSATVTITRTGTTTTPVSVDVTTSNGTGTAGVDYTAVNATVVFGAGVTSRTVTVPIVPNTSVDGTRTVNLALSSPTSPAALGTAATAVLSIVDDDSTLALGAAAYSVTEGGAVTVTVRRTGSPLGTVSVGYNLTGITAIGAWDYPTLSGRLTFGPGVMSQTFSVRTLADDLAEGDETVRVVLSAPAGQATLGTPATAIVTIVDVPPVVRFGATAYTVTEGTPAATITVLRSGPSAGSVTVNYGRIGGTATGGGVDFTYTQGTLTFGPGVTSRTFTVPIVNDSIPEGPETIIFQLTGAAGAVVGTPNTTTLTIQDNEPQVQFASAAYTVGEATPSATITVVRAGSTTVPVTVNYARIGGTATGGGVDYSFTPGTLTFGPGVTSRTFTVAISNDSLAEAPETVVFELSGATGASIGTPSTTTLTIVDNEPQVRFASASYTASETTGTVWVTVQRTGSTLGTVTVDYAVSGGTAGGGDYALGGAGTLTFGPGVTSQRFPVAIINDTVAEAVETIVLALDNPVNATLAAPSIATINLSSDDLGGRIQFASPLFTQSEGGGDAVITITRVGGLASAVTVTLATVDGSARAGTHYTAVGATVTFAAGQTSATVAVPLIDNGMAEAGRWLGLVLTAPGGGATLSTPNTAVLWIADDD